MRRLLHVTRRERVRPLEDVAHKQLVQRLHGHGVLSLVQHGEGRLDLLVQEELQRRLPELVDALGVEAGVDADDQVGLLHDLALDVSVVRERDVAG